MNVAQAWAEAYKTVAPNVAIQVQKQAVTTLLPKGTIKDAQ